MNRRQFLAGLTATTAAGLLIPERNVWALDRTMVRGNHIFHWVNDPLDMRVFDPVTHGFPNPWMVGDYKDYETWMIPPDPSGVISSWKLSGVLDDGTGWTRTVIPHADVPVRVEIAPYGDPMYLQSIRCVPNDLGR